VLKRQSEGESYLSKDETTPKYSVYEGDLRQHSAKTKTKYITKTLEPCWFRVDGTHYLSGGSQFIDMDTMLGAISHVYRYNGYAQGKKSEDYRAGNNLPRKLDVRIAKREVRNIREATKNPLDYRQCNATIGDYERYLQKVMREKGADPEQAEKVSERIVREAMQMIGDYKSEKRTVPGCARHGRY